MITLFVLMTLIGSLVIAVKLIWFVTKLWIKLSIGAIELVLILLLIAIIL